MDRAESVGLATELVLGEGKQAPPAFPGRRLGDHPVEAAQSIVGVPRADRRLGMQVLGIAVALSQPIGLDPAGCPVAEVVERVAAPEREGLVGGVPGTFGLSGRELLPRPQEQVLEPQVVEVVAMHGEAIASSRRGDRRRAERLAQTNHATLDDLGP